MTYLAVVVVGSEHGGLNRSAVPQSSGIITAHSAKSGPFNPHLRSPVNPSSLEREGREGADKVGWGVVSKLNPHSL